MRCLDCKHLDLKSYPKHSNMGFGKCAHDPVGSFVSITISRACELYVKTTVEITIKRESWALGADLIKVTS